MTTQTDTAMTVTGPPRWPSEADPEIDPGPEAILIAISRDGGVKAYTGKVDYGQGIRSGFAHAIAEELGVYPSRVDVVMGDTAQVPYDRATVGSASTRTVGLQLRRAAASAGQTLREKAAQKWRVRTEKVVIRGGIAFTPDRPDRSASISQLLGDEKLDIQVRDDVKLKDTDDFRIIGQPLTRTDAVARVTGAAKYTRDISLPGMLHGKMLRPPSYGAKLLQLDASRAERTPGFVSLVQDGDFVGVVAESEEAAEYALQAIRSRWEEDRGTASDWNLPALLKETAGERVTLREEGSLDDGFRRADHILEGTYFVPYVANAQMEPSAAVASWDGDYLTVWAANRAPFQERQNLAEWLGIGEYRVRVITPEIGGSFGTKTSTAGYEAARLSQAVGRPVRLTYSREEEFSWSTVRPAALMEVRSGVTEDGEIVAWDYIAYHAGENAFRGRRGADTPYDTGNVRIAVANTESPLRSGSYRSLGGAVNHFARECHMDEIAARLGLDPLELRLRNLSHPRMRRALTTAADKFGWAER
ncbi:MAG: molybdopterin cofactor-binding domain-containing protein, partial [Chloroflexota bacterium]